MSNKWNLDPTHSEIGFKVKHLMMTNVSGTFKKFDASFETAGDDFTTAKVQFSAETGSVDTGNEQRDGHLAGADFFDAPNHPHLKFESTAIEKTGEGTYHLHGNLTIREHSKPVTLEVEHGGYMKDPWGNTKAGFSLSGKISRKDWGLTWNAPLEAGGVLVSDDVKIHGEVQFAQQA